MKKLILIVVDKNNRIVGGQVFESLLTQEDIQGFVDYDRQGYGVHLIKAENVTIGAEYIHTPKTLPEKLQAISEMGVNPDHFVVNDGYGVTLRDFLNNLEEKHG